MWHDESHSLHVVEHSGYGAHVLPCEHQPQPLSSTHEQTDLAAEHVSTQLRRHIDRHDLWLDGHSRHVSVHWSAGAHDEVDEHQPHPGASAAHEQTSAAVEHTATELTLRGTTLVLSRAGGANARPSGSDARSSAAPAGPRARRRIRPKVLGSEFASGRPLSLGWPTYLLCSFLLRIRYSYAAASVC